MAENKKEHSRLDTDSSNNSGSSTKKDTFENVTRSYQKGWGYAEIAIQYGVAIILCTLIGHWLDNKLDSGYILMITGLIVGTVAGFIGLLKSLNALNTKNKHDRNTKV